MNNIKTIRDAIKNKVSQMATLVAVYDYETGEVTGTPFATVSPMSGITDWGDSAGSQSGRNIQTIEYVVKIFQGRDLEDFDAQTAENISLNVLDELLTAFNNDTTLSGTVLWQKPSNWQMEYEVIDQIVRTLQVTIQVGKSIDSK